MIHVLVNLNVFTEFHWKYSFDCVHFQRISSEMKSFFTSQQELHALECWEIYVQICGQVPATI